MSSLYKRKLKDREVWYVNLKLPDGRRKSINTGCETKAAAKQVAVEFERKILLGFDPFDKAAADSETLKQLAGRWYEATVRKWEPKTAENRRNSIKHAVSFFGNVRPEVVTQARIRDYREHLAQSLSNSTVNSKLTDLRHILNFGRDNGHPKIAKLRRDHLPEPTRHDDYLTESEISAFLAAAERVTLNGVPVRDYFAFLIQTAMRRSEALKCRREWIRDGIIHVPAVDKIGGVQIRVTKNGKSRRIPVTPEITEILSRCPVRGLLFPKFTIEVTRRFQTVLKLAGIERDLKMHNTRDTFVARGLKAGMSPNAMKEIVGDDWDTLLAHYAGISASDLKEQGRKAPVFTKLLPDVSND